MTPELTNTIPNKLYIIGEAERIVEPAKNGLTSPLETFAKLKAINEMTAKAMELIKPEALTELERYGKGGKDSDAFKIETADRTDYDFSTCNDSVWNDLQLQLSYIKECIKKRETFLKSLTEPVANPETGELITPPNRKTLTTIKTTFK